MLKGRRRLHDIRGQVKAAGYPQDVAEVIHEAGDTKQQIFSVDKTAFYRKRCHLGLS